VRLAADVGEIIQFGWITNQIEGGIDSSMQVGTLKEQVPFDQKEYEHKLGEFIPNLFGLLKFS